MIELDLDFEIKVHRLGDQDMPGDDLKRLIEERSTSMTDRGWSLLAMGSRGGSMYLVFRREKTRKG